MSVECEALKMFEVFIKVEEMKAVESLFSSVSPVGILIDGLCANTLNENDRKPT